MKLLDRLFPRRQSSIDTSVNSVLAVNKGSGDLSVNVEQTVNEFPPELVKVLQDQGIAKDAIDNFFKILRVKHIPEHEWKKTLEELALRHLELIEATAILNPTSADTEELKEKVLNLVSNANYDEAESVVNEIQEHHSRSARHNKDNLISARATYEKQLEAYQKEQLASAEASAYNAMLMDRQHKYLEAIEYYKISIAKCEEILQLSETDYSLYLAVYLINMGNTLQRNASYDIAETSFLRSLEIIDKFDLRPEVYVSVKNALAESYRHEGRLVEAISLHLESLATLENEGLLKTSLAAGIYNNLGQVYSSKGEYLKSRDNYCKALKFYRSNFGIESIDVSLVLNNIANLYLTIGYYERSKKFLEKSLKIKEKILGSHHTSTINSMASLARAYHLLKNYDLAEAAFNNTQRKITDIGLGKHPIMAATLTNYAAMHHDLNNPKLAKNLYLEALAILDVENTQEIALSSILHNLGLISREEDNIQESIEYFTRSLVLKDKTVSLAHAEAISTLNALTETIRYSGNSELLKKHYFSFYRKFKKQFGDTNIALANLLNDLGNIYKSENKYQKAIKIFLESYRVKKGILGDNHPRSTTTCNNLAESYHVIRFYDQSESYYLKALSIIEEAAGKDNSSYTNCLRNYEIMLSEKNCDLDKFYVNASIDSRNISFFSEGLESCFLQRLEASKEIINPSIERLAFSNYIVFGCEKFHAILFLEDSEIPSIEYRLKNEQNPFPGLVVVDENPNVAIKLEKASNCVIENCVVHRNHGVHLDGDSSVILTNYYQKIQTPRLGSFESNIKLGFLVGIQNDPTSFRLKNTLNSLMSKL